MLVELRAQNKISSYDVRRRAGAGGGDAHRIGPIDPAGDQVGGGVFGRVGFVKAVVNARERSAQAVVEPQLVAENRVGVLGGGEQFVPENQCWGSGGKGCVLAWTRDAIYPSLRLVSGRAKKNMTPHAPRGPLDKHPPGFCHVRGQHGGDLEGRSARK